MTVVWLGVGVGFGLDGVYGKTKVFVAVNALFSLRGLVVPNCHSDV